MKRIRGFFLTLLAILSFSFASFAASVDPSSGLPKNSITVSDVKHLTISKMEKQLGRRMTTLEKTAFRLNKKKYLAFVRATEPGMNGWAIAGFITSFFIGPLGIIFSLIALNKIKKTGQQGHGFAIAGLVIGIITTAMLFFL